MQKLRRHEGILHDFCTTSQRLCMFGAGSVDASRVNARQDQDDDCNVPRMGQHSPDRVSEVIDKRFVTGKLPIRETQSQTQRSPTTRFVGLDCDGWCIFTVGGTRPGGDTAGRVTVCFLRSAFFCFLDTLFVIRDTDR